MISSPPPKPTGFDPEAFFDQSLHERTFGAPSRFNNTSGVKANRRSTGTAMKQIRPSANGSNVVLELYLVAVFLQYTVCEDSAGNYYRVAKPPELDCTITQETSITGAVYNYTYPYGSGNQLYCIYRVSTGPNGPEYQGIVPEYAAPSTGGVAGNITGQSIIFADPLQTPIQFPDDPSEPADWNLTGTPTFYVERSARAWTAFYDQTFQP